MSPFPGQENMQPAGLRDAGVFREGQGLDAFDQSRGVIGQAEEAEGPPQKAPLFLSSCQRL
jgi:hypothetical protein